MLVYLIRHAQTDWNIENRCQGFSDGELNAAGRRQAELIARRLSNMRIEAIYSSTLKRAYETACIIAKYHDAVVQSIDDLRELHQGEFEGLTLAELMANHSDFLERWLRDPADIQLPGGESMREMQDRAWAALEKIVERHPEGNVVVVGHNLCNMALLCRIMNLDLNDFRRLKQDEGTMNVIEFEGRWAHPVVLRLNDTCHLG